MCKRPRSGETAFFVIEADESCSDIIRGEDSSWWEQRGIDIDEEYEHCDDGDFWTKDSCRTVWRQQRSTLCSFGAPGSVGLEYYTISEDEDCSSFYDGEVEIVGTLSSWDDMHFQFYSAYDRCGVVEGVNMDLWVPQGEDCMELWRSEARLCTASLDIGTVYFTKHDDY